MGCASVLLLQYRNHGALGGTSLAVEKVMAAAEQVRTSPLTLLVASRCGGTEKMPHTLKPSPARFEGLPAGEGATSEHSAAPDQLPRLPFGTRLYTGSLPMHSPPQFEVK